MTEPTVSCPNCGTEIRLTESLAAPLLSATRAQFEQRIARMNEAAAKREAGLRDREKQLADARRAMDEQIAGEVASRLQTERQRVIAEESKKAKLASAAELDARARELADLQAVLKSRDEKLAEAQRSQADILRKQRELDDARRELELTVEKRVQDGLTEARARARKEAE